MKLLNTRQKQSRSAASLSENAPILPAPSALMFNQEVQLGRKALLPWWGAVSYRGHGVAREQGGPGAPPSWSCSPAWAANWQTRHGFDREFREVTLMGEGTMTNSSHIPSWPEAKEAMHLHSRDECGPKPPKHPWMVEPASLCRRDTRKLCGK